MFAQVDKNKLDQNSEIYEGGEFMITEKMPHAAKHFFVEDDLQSDSEDENELCANFMNKTELTKNDLCSEK